MDPKTIYLAGPMRGKPLYNFAAFATAAMELREKGIHVLSPAERDMAAGFNPALELGDPAQEFSLGDAFRWDFEAICRVDAVVVLPGWRASSGVQAELVLAFNLGRPVFEYDDGDLVPVTLTGYTVDLQTA